MKLDALQSLALDALNELQAQDLRLLDVAALTTIADVMVICSGRSARHVKRLGENLIQQAKRADLKPGVEGLARSEWVLIDLGGVIVHIMQPVTRAHYQLEKLWDMDSRASESG